MAQSVERRIGSAEVTGPIPVSSSIESLERSGDFCCLFIIPHYTLDILGIMGYKIVLSGMDSLGFLFTEVEQFYDRCILLHTTFIPYREFRSVLEIKEYLDLLDLTQDINRGNEKHIET